MHSIQNDSVPAICALAKFGATLFNSKALAIVL